MRTHATRQQQPARTPVPRGTWQARSRVSAPSDPAEREADHMADDALRTTPAARPAGVDPAPATAPAATYQRQAAEDGDDHGPSMPYPDETDEDWDEVAAASRSSSPGLTPPGFGESVASAGSGQALPAPVQARMGNAFGHPFDSVRVHTDAEAGRLADRIDARAFTRGSDVYFAPGEYAPGTSDGERLLAHELSHTIQQGGPEIRRQPKKKGTPNPNRIDPTTLTDEAKVNLRLEIQAAATAESAKDKAKYKADPTVDPVERARWTQAIDAAITNGAGIADPAQKEVRLGFLRALRRQMDNDFFAWLLVRRYVVYTSGVAGITDAGDPGTTSKPGQLQIWKRLAAQLGGTVDQFLQVVNVQGEYQKREVTPKDLATAEAGAGEDVGAAGDDTIATTHGDRGGAIAGETVEQRKLLEELHAALGDLASEDTPPGDQELLIHQLEQMSLEKRKDFYEFVRGIVESQPEGDAETKTLTDLVDLFQRLDPASREALRVNRQIKESEPRGDKPLPKQVLLDLGKDVAPLQDMAENARRINSNLDLIRNATINDETRKALQGMDFGTAAFFEEIAMLQGLLAGAGRESELVRDVGQQLITEIVHFQQRVQRELQELAAETVLLAALAVATEGAASPALLRVLVKIKKLKQFIDTVQRAYNIYQRIESAVSLVERAGAAYETFRGYYDTATTAHAKLESMLDSLEGDEDLEEAIEAQEDKLVEEFEKQFEGKFGEILEMMYIPEDTPPEELRTILFNLPRGLTALEHAWDFYRAGRRDEHFTEVLAVRAFAAGRLLYPLVGLTAALAAEQLQASFPERTVEDRINRLMAKSKRGPGIGKRNRSLFGRLGRKHYDYDEATLLPHLQAAKDALRKAIDDDEPGTTTSGHWAPAWFKATVRREIREVNKGFRGKTVTATKKTKKPGGGTEKTKEVVPVPPFRVRVKRPLLASKRLEVVIKVNPQVTLDVDRLTNDDFKAGVDFGGSEIRRNAIRKWLRDAGYQVIRDGNGNEHIRLEGGDREMPNRSYLHIAGGKTIKKGIDGNAFRSFLGRVVHDSRELPEGYHLYHEGGNDIVSLKGGLGKAGHPKLGLDAAHKLVEGGTAQPPLVVRAAGITMPAGTEGYDFTAAVETMFEPKTAGSPDYHLQDRKKKDLWTKLVAGEPKLKRRPTAAKGRLGYTVRARAFGDRLGSHHLTGLHTDDDKGHLIARRFGGVDDYDNLVPMLRRQNQFPGKWFGMESDMADVYVGKKAAGNHVVDFELSLIYPSAKTRRPSKFVTRYQELALTGSTATSVGGPKSRTVDND